MKKEKIKYQVFITLLSIVFFLASCLKDSGPVQDFSKSPAVVSFQGDGNGNNTGGIAVLGSSTQANPVVDSLGISLGVSSLYLKTPVTVQVTPDQESLDSFNSQNGTSYTLLPAAGYTLENGGAWTIPAGKNLVYFKVSFDGTNIDFTKNNALALKITSAGNVTIASNLSSYILLVNLKSPYDDTYTASGQILRYAGAAPVSPTDSIPITGPMALNTVSASSVDGTLPIAGFTAVDFTLVINPDNTVTIEKSLLNPGVDVSNTSGLTSTYDPASKTFTLYGGYLNAAGALRQFHVSLVAQ